ncbi:Pyridoxamine 5'-phosphate oxidase [Verrucomicrobium sp. GAS474]|uniref:pyridoxamine 5'-phosphate oxidase n=1 Tax=Verrucomicrobium sp. GAS474 TaxID=1882831 RepID=UPI00087CEA60|nr:pyridoxamine 5'-phosphate oxidase [Verrucomicrobium sp. GAS474]SDT88199.1 Pyridoxamine 5'-phosphate oxidase [Verrucomicrobium sp. GAS474]
MVNPMPNDSSPATLNDIAVSSLRRDYVLRGLAEDDLDANPFRQFARWFQDAIDAKIQEPNAMIVSTVSPEGQPRGRIMLLKEFNEQGFVFFTNYQSEKARHLTANPRAGLTFSWLDLERQITIEGRAEKISRPETTAYFESRPLGSRIGAWVSNQSEVIPSREAINNKLAEVKARFATGEVPVPDHWGGYRLAPVSIEFWQGRTNRLHDRLRYRRDSLGKPWKVERLAP